MHACTCFRLEWKRPNEYINFITTLKEWTPLTYILWLCASVYVCCVFSVFGPKMCTVFSVCNINLKNVRDNEQIKNSISCDSKRFAIFESILRVSSIGALLPVWFVFGFFFVRVALSVHSACITSFHCAGFDFVHFMEFLVGPGKQFCLFAVVCNVHHVFRVFQAISNKWMYRLRTSKRRNQNE